MTKNFNSLDVAKLIAAILVVSIHKNPFHPGLLDDIFVGMMGRIAVSFFYIASAFFLFLKTPVTGTTITHYLKRLFILFVFWFVIEVPFMYLKYFANSPTVYDAMTFVQQLFFGNVYNGAYFIVALIEGVPLVYFLSKFLSNTWLFMIGLILYLFCAVCDTYYTVAPMFVRQVADAVNLVIGDISVSFVPAIIFIVAGKVIADNYTKISSCNLAYTGLLLILSMIFYLMEVKNIAWGGYMLVSRIPTAILIFIFVLNIKLEKQLPYKSFRKLSTIIFFSHFIFVEFTYLFYFHFTEVLHLDNTGQFFFVLLLSLLTYFIMTQGSKKKMFRWMRWGY